MVNKLFEYVLKSLPGAVVMILAGFLIAHLILANPQAIDMTLFILGAIPVVFFLPGVFSNSASGALHSPKVIFRKVNTLERKDTRSSGKDEKISFISPLCLVIAGLLTWLAGFILA